MGLFKAKLQLCTCFALPHSNIPSSNPCIAVGTNVEGTDRGFSTEMEDNIISLLLQSTLIWIIFYLWQGCFKGMEEDF